MESVKEFIDAAERRSALVARLRGMLEASVPLPPESPATPKSELNFAKGFPEPAKDEYPAVWEHLYKELWNPEPEGDGTETNGAQIFVSLVDPADPSENPSEMEPDDPGYLYGIWKFILEQVKTGTGEACVEGVEAGFNNWTWRHRQANNYPLPRDSEETVPHLDLAMAEFNTAMIKQFGMAPSQQYPLLTTHSTGPESAFWHFKRALANLEDYGEEGGGASARYAAQKREVRENVERRIAEYLEKNAAAWQSNAQKARDAEEAAAALDGSNDFAAAADAWENVKELWTIAIAAKNGWQEDNWELDFSGPEGEECEKGIAEADAKEKAAREKAK